MKIETKKISHGQIELTIELTVDEYQPFLKQAAQKISQTTKIPGFRPGKAPFEAVKRQLGEAEIWQRALEPAVKKTLVQALVQKELLTVGAPKVDIVKLAPGNPVVYKATISLLPKVQLADYSKIKVKAQPIIIKEERVDKALADLQKMHAKEALVDRAAQKGDKVEIDFETFLDKIPLDQGKQQKFPLVIGEGTFIPGFEDQIIGLKKDETKQFQLKFPGNYYQKNLAGRFIDFKVKMLAVYQLDSPQLDDKFAQSLGKFKTLKEVKDKIKANLKTDVGTKERQRLEEEIIDKIIAQSTFDEIPDLLIDSETKKMVEELEQNLTSQGLKFENYLNHLKKKREDLFLDFVPQAIKRVKSALVIREVAKKEKVNVADQEVEVEIQKTLEVYAGNPEIEKQLHQPDYKNYLKNILSARKVIDYLKSVMVKKT